MVKSVFHDGESKEKIYTYICGYDCNPCTSQWWLIAYSVMRRRAWCLSASSFDGPLRYRDLYGKSCPIFCIINRLRWSQAHFSHIALQLSIYTLLIRNSSHVNTSQPQATANANTRPQSPAASIHHGLDGYVTFIITDKTYGKRYQIKVTENTGRNQTKWNAQKRRTSQTKYREKSERKPSMPIFSNGAQSTGDRH